MIKLKHIKQVFRAEDIQTTALQSIDLEVNQGDFLAIMGPSGCGKSTLLNILGLLDNPTDGSYVFLDTEVSKLPERELAKIRKKNIGFVFQDFNLIDELTVFQNVELALLYLNLTKEERKKRVYEMLKEVSLEHRASHYPIKLSGGQQQRVAIARALVSRPKLIVADEPTGNLDSKLGHEIMELLSKFNREGTTLIMVTHTESHSRYASRVISLLDGKVVAWQDKTALEQSA
ncbi:ABC transporter ATP-binding protein [Thalassomonas viridans]|uniref:ABC transporter ATP-binding protein n=1 Tax=Thalassomonas viridans TaxID=137584 RepID=A0AAE9ZBL1_9GAMM|nr:ABC transporter ATP-binding protein [Thalassomonas viridans]WDE09279.1 ABC transporter ATP-binding protein [Thalassomonas viridans]